MSLFALLSLGFMAADIIVLCPPPKDPQRNAMLRPQGDVMPNLSVGPCRFKVPAQDHLGQGNPRFVLGKRRADTAAVGAAEGQELGTAVGPPDKTLRVEAVRFGINFRVVMDGRDGDDQRVPGRD